MPPTTRPTQTAKPVVVLFDVDETLVHRGFGGEKLEGGVRQALRHPRRYRRAQLGG